MPSGVGFGPMGMNEKMKTNTRKTKDAILIGNPARPSLNFEGRSGSPRTRLRVMQAMDTIYDARMAAVESDAMFISATEEPRLISERRQDTANERQMALMGTSHLGATC
jgi:hypothetical protein